MLLNLLVSHSMHSGQLSFADLEFDAGDPVDETPWAAEPRTQPAAEPRTQPAASPPDEPRRALPATPPPLPTSTAAEAAVLALLTSRLAQLDAFAARPPLPVVSLEQARDEWLRRLR